MQCTWRMKALGRSQDGAEVKWSEAEARAEIQQLETEEEAILSAALELAVRETQSATVSRKWVGVVQSRAIVLNIWKAACSKYVIVIRFWEICIGCFKYQRFISIGIVCNSPNKTAQSKMVVLYILVSRMLLNIYAELKHICRIKTKFYHKNRHFMKI